MVRLLFFATLTHTQDIQIKFQPYLPNLIMHLEQEC